MSVTVKSVSARTINTGIRASAVSSWRDVLTLVRMGLAFLFPWPFMTNRLETAVESRARRLAARSVRGVDKPR